MDPEKAHAPVRWFGAAAAGVVLASAMFACASEMRTAVTQQAQRRAGEYGDYRNPILPGFYPDPSICRVGDDYYLVTSSFEYFPGVPIFHSKDLVHWRQIGHCLTRASQLPLANAKSSQGIFAPTLRYHDGTFYLVTTNISSGGNFYVTTTDPAGEWSEPAWLGEAKGWMDPSLFFDDDGKVYYTRHDGGERGGVVQSELDLASGKLASEPRLIWKGTGGVWPEGPHLYKIGSFYYLLISEGGTSYHHMLTVARAPAPFGPFEPYAGNPILTHRHHPELPIQATGHGDLVTDPHGHWWMVLLGIRPWDGRHHHLGRETFLAPVQWNEAAWPVVNEGAPLAESMSTAGLPPSHPWEPLPPRDDFSSDRLSFVWNFVRNPSDADWSLSARRGWLRLLGTAVSLDDVASPAFVGRRQQHYRCRASALVDFEPKSEKEEAGLVVRADEKNHVEFVIAGGRGARRARLRTRLAGVSHTVAEAELPAGLVVLTVRAREEQYDFSWSTEGGASHALGSAPTLPLSSEAAGGFTGAYLGMYASAGDSTNMPPADFDWFEYAAE
jgi:xylan 1,4-beta-xylosidase